MASVYHFRNRNYCLAFLMFQFIFVAIQVVIFYPCWQGAPQSTIFRKHVAPSTIALSGFEQHRARAQAAMVNTGDKIKELVNQGASYVQVPPNIGADLKEQAKQQQHKVIAAAGQVMDAVSNQIRPKTTTPGIAGGINRKTAEQMAAEVRLQEAAKLKSQRLKLQGMDEQRAFNEDQLKTPKSKYNTSWASLDSRPNPQWYDAGKIGIFIHWGVFSVPSFSVANGLSEWFWFYWKNEQFIKPVDEHNQKKLAGFIEKRSKAIKGVKDYAAKMYGPKWKYTDFASGFKAEMFDAKRWASVFKESGAKYVVLTSKHHDGFTLWPSKRSWNWNSVDVGPHRDIVGELGKAVKDAGLHYGLYHSLYEWFNPKYIQDKKTGFTTQTFIKEKMMPELKDLVTMYNPDIVWSDGQFEAPCSYWNCTDFLVWLYNESPVKDTVVTNDRWGSDVLCKHGGYLTCADRYNPDKRQTKKWENCMTIDRESWGYRRNAVLKDYYSMKELLELLAQTVSKGGNLLMNIGPTADGRIPPIFEERLLQLGAWLTVNGEGIYGTSTWSVSKDPTSKHVYYTQKSTGDGPVIFAILLSWPEDDRLDLAAPQPSTQTRATWLGYRSEPLTWQKGTVDGSGMVLVLPKVSLTQIPCQWAWVFKITNLLNAVV